MIERSAKLIRFGLGVIVAGSIVSAVYVFSPREPTYKEQSYSYWLDRLPLTPQISFRGNPLQAIFRIRYPVTLPLHVFTAGTNPISATAAELNLKESEMAVAAVEQVGTNGLPILLTRLGSRQGAVKQTIIQWAVKLKWAKPPRLTADMRRAQALTAISRLGRRAESIMPELMILAQHSDTNVSATARFALELIRDGGQNQSPRFRGPPPLLL